MVEKFLFEYQGLKSRWDHIITDSSKTIIQSCLNQILWSHHIRSFESSEWGELTDFSALQDKIQNESKARIMGIMDQLPETIKSLQDVYNSLLDNIEILGDKNPLLSAEESRINSFMDALKEAYGNELKLKKKVVDFLNNCDYLNLPYDVIVTIGDMWSSKVYINNRMIGHVEKFLEFEVNGLKALMSEK